MDKPCEGCAFRNYDRLNDGQRGDGEIVNVDLEEEEVIVQYKGSSVVWEGPDFVIWEGVKCYPHKYLRVDGILYHPSTATLDPSMVYKGGDIDSFHIDELTYDSSDGGEGLWYVG